MFRYLNPCIISNKINKVIYNSHIIDVTSLFVYVRWIMVCSVLGPERLNI